MFDRLIRLSVGNSVFVHLLFILVVAAGLMAASNLPREEFPEISLDRIAVVVPYPGATAADVEELIVRPIEDALSDVADIEEYKSTAREGTGTVIVTFVDGTDLAAARSEVEKAVTSVQRLPEESETPVVTELKLELPVASLALTGDPGATLVIDRVADELRHIDGVATVLISGASERKIVVDIDERKLRVLGLSPGQLAVAIRSAHASLPAGSVETAGQDIFVKTEKRLQSAADVARIPVAPGNSLRIGDVADVREITEPNDTRFWVDGVRAVKLTIGREKNADPITIREALERELPEIRAFVPGNMKLRSAEDFTQSIRDRLDTLLLNAATGGALVIIVLMVMSGFRQAMLALVGMPVSYLVATFLMDQTNMTINVVSTFGLLIATGIIVDDAIVVIENVQRHLEMGKSRTQATIDGTNEVLLPVSVAVLTTVLAFVPLTMVGGTMGRVMQILPTAVIFCLIGSMLEAVLILPGHLSEFASKSAVDSRTARLGRRMQAVYRPALNACIRHPFVTILVTMLALGATGVRASQMPAQIGAPGKPFELEVLYEVSPGLTREFTRSQGEEIDAIIREHVDPDLISVTSLRVGSTLDPETSVSATGANLGQIRWQFEVTPEFAAHYPTMVRDLRYRLAIDPDLARTSVKEVQAGPPTGAAVTARIRGRDTGELDSAMADVKAALYAMDGITDVSDNYGAGKETFKVLIDQDRAALYGLTELDVAQTVRTALDGLLATQVSIDEEPVEIVVRYAHARTASRRALGDLLISTVSGGVVRLDQVATLTRVRDVAKIIREDGLRTVVIYADADRKVLPPTVAAEQLRAAWDEQIAERYPELRLSFGGEADELADSLKDLPYAFALAFAGIYIVLALQFRSYLQPAIIMSAVPFGLMGAIWGLTASGYPLSLMSMFGMVALTGIVVNDSLVMVDFINMRRREGASLADGVRQGALQRLRPIVSTTLTTCLGLLPLAIGLGGQDLVLAPMALAITAGLGIATLLVLLVVPALYLVVEGLRGASSRDPSA
ncbi:MAG: efflux RND transporter permease subunit [Nannocystaceae bacterium]|nr:efflux RND transporter permease subunit [Nannocystaceae bacterium]